MSPAAARTAPAAPSAPPTATVWGPLWTLTWCSRGSSLASPVSPTRKYSRDTRVCENPNKTQKLYLCFLVLKLVENRKKNKKSKILFRGVKYKADRMIALADQDISSSDEEKNYSVSSSEEEVFELC